MKTKTYIIEQLKKHKLDFQKRFDVKSMAIFGSISRDEATKTSDIDILVDIKPSYKNYYMLKKTLEEMFETKVDLVTTHSLRSFIKDEIQKDLIYV